MNTFLRSMFLIQFSPKAWQKMFIKAFKALNQTSQFQEHTVYTTNIWFEVNIWKSGRKDSDKKYMNMYLKSLVYHT